MPVSQRKFNGLVIGICIAPIWDFLFSFKILVGWLYKYRPFILLNPIINSNSNPTLKLNLRSSSMFLEPVKSFLIDKEEPFKTWSEI